MRKAWLGRGRERWLYPVFFFCLLISCFGLAAYYIGGRRKESGKGRGAYPNVDVKVEAVGR